MHCLFLTEKLSCFVTYIHYLHIYFDDAVKRKKIHSICNRNVFMVLFLLHISNLYVELCESGHERNICFETNDIKVMLIGK